MRTASVLVPRSTSQESNGLRIAPAAFWMNFSHSMSSSRVAITMPPMLSLCPLRYFVVLWTTMSAPSSMGRCRHGLAKVLSTTSRALPRCAMAAACAMSVRRSTGLVGVSMNTSRVSGRMACSMSSGRDVSTYENVRANFVRTLSNRRNVPPYVLSVTTTWSPAFSMLVMAPMAAMPDA